MLKEPWPPIRQTILVSVLALIGTGPKTSAHRWEPFTSASGVCAGSAAQSEVRGAENPTFGDKGLGVGVADPIALSGTHATLRSPAAKNIESPYPRRLRPIVDHQYYRSWPPPVPRLSSFYRGRIHRTHPVHRVGEVLGEILHLELRFRALGGNPVAEHRQAEGTGGRHPGRLSPQRLLDPRMVDARPDLLLHPHAAAAGATAEPTLVVALDLDELRAPGRFADRPRRGVHVVPHAAGAGV